MHLVYKFASLDCLISLISGGPVVVIFQLCVSFCWLYHHLTRYVNNAHPGITMIMAIFVILMTTKLKSTQRNLMQYSFLRKLVKSIHFLELFVSFVSLCTVRGLHFSEDSFSFNLLLRPEVRPFVSVRIFTRGPSGLFEFQISKFKIRSLSDQVN